MLILIVTLTSSEARAIDTWYQANARAIALEQGGQLAEAARTLEPFVAEYPQDYSFAIRLAWLWFRAGHYVEAELEYRRARALSGGSLDSELGLAWSWLRLGRKGDAADGFRAVLAVSPGNESATAGLELARATPFVAWPVAALTAHLYSDHPAKDWGLGVRAGLSGILIEHVYLGADYRFTHVTPPTVRGPVQQGSAFDQHEVWAGAGATWPAFGFTARYGFVSDGSGYLGDGQVIGASVRASPYGDIVLEGSASLWEDVTIARVALSYAVPVTSFLVLRPHVAIQEVSSETLVSGGGVALLHGAPGSLWVGGRGGDEFRPAYLDAVTTYDFTEHILAAAVAGGQVNLGGGAALQVEYEFLSLELDEPVFGYTTTTHLITVGVSATLGD